MNLRIKFKVKSSVISDSVTLWWKLDVFERKRPLYSYVLSETRTLSSWEKNLGGLQCVITCEQNKLLVKLAKFKRNIPPVFPRQICWKRLGLLDRLVCDDWTQEIFPTGMNIKFSFFSFRLNKPITQTKQFNQNMTKQWIFYGGYLLVLSNWEVRCPMARHKLLPHLWCT